jgi:dTDP-4-amino-4,6-dideoxygalactose transaminase
MVHVTPKPIPFNRPFVGGYSEQYLLECLASGHLSGDGVFTKRSRELLESLLGVARVLLTTSCTHALEMAALLLDIRPGDEVILPTYTFVSTVNAFVLRGATPRFVDIRPDTLNLDERLVPAAVGDRTRVIVPVHYAGVGCEMEALSALALKQDLSIVEDNAHGLFGRYRGKLLGSFGVLGTQSFHETKNLSCGEGGALLVNEPGLIEQAEIIREKGTNRSRFFRGQVDKYTWVGLGSSYLPSELLAALLLAQLEARDEIQLARRRVWERYATGLGAWAKQYDVRLPFVPDYCEQTWHMFYIILPSLDSRQRLIAYLRAQHISAVFHYVPLHLSSMGKRFGGREGQCPVAEDLSGRLLRLPFFYDLSETEQSRVIDAIQHFQP